MFLAGLEKFFDFLQDRVDGVDWDGARNAMVSLMAIVLLLDAALLVAIWYPQRELWLRIKIAYYKSIHDKEKETEYEEKIWWNPRSARFASALLTSMLFLSMFLAVIAVIIGISWLGISAVVRSSCFNTVGSLDGVCLDLTAFGFDKIECGDDFRDVCNAFTARNDIHAAWGALIYVLAQFYLIAGGAMAMYQQRAETAALATIRNFDVGQSSATCNSAKEDAANGEPNGSDAGIEPQKESFVSQDKELQVGED